LKHFCKRYKRNKKNRKRKEENKLKIEKGPEEPIWPGIRIGLQPIYSFPESVPSFSLPLTDRRPHLSASSPPPFPPFSLWKSKMAGVTYSPL
jgi:hypothetical protein